MANMKLTARQLKYFEEISLDKESCKQTEKVALQFAANMFNELLKRERDLWNEIAEIYGIDLTEAAYTIKNIDGEICAVKVEE